MEQLRKELLFRSVKPSGIESDSQPLPESPYEIVSIFFGGGTPSFVPFSEIAKTMELIHTHFPVAKDAEITIECNPSSTMKLALLTYKRAGFNRISFGLQSANDEELAFLGRTHRYIDFLKAYEDARLSGFNNINVDLMNGIPLQTARSFQRTLKNISMLRPEHLSIYNLIVEKGTRFFRMQEEGNLPIPGEEELLEMDSLSLEWTKKMGMERYEISNYAKEGFASIHNYNYWSDVPYLGFGLGASSYFQKTRWKNLNSLVKYMKIPLDDEKNNSKSEASSSENAQNAPEFLFTERENIEKLLTEDKHVLSKEEQMEEFFFLGLRRTEGISEMDFVARFSVDLHQLYGETLSKLVEEGYLIHKNARYFFTPEGLDLSNQLLVRFL
jgi:putative coproporphyrinogen dehydrogenase